MMMKTPCGESGGEFVQSSSCSSPFTVSPLCSFLRVCSFWFPTGPPERGASDHKACVCLCRGPFDENFKLGGDLSGGYGSITSTPQSVDRLGRPYLDFVVPPGKESLFPRVAVGHRSGIPGRVVGVDTVCPAPSLCARLLCFPSLQCLFGVRIKRKHWAQN